MISLFKKGGDQQFKSPLVLTFSGERRSFTGSCDSSIILSRRFIEYYQRISFIIY